MSAAWRDQALHRYYWDRPGWEDGTEHFHRLCRAIAKPGCRILEVGAGPSNSTSRFLATLGEVHGVDPGEEVLSNDALKSASVIEGDVYPFPSDWFDACISNYVVEHVADPLSHLREISRILRPGGAYAFRTPNRWHYVAIVSAATPHSFHR